ncbi:MAG: class I SAM-dependent methyltransferase [Rhizomicrobium sp.]
MPASRTQLHVQMLEAARKEGQPERDGLYGLHWGDPDSYPPLVPVRDHWLLPYVRSDGTALEIGPGGGRWTRYLLPFRRVYVVDHYPELLAELRKTLPHPHIVEILNNGADFPGVPRGAVDFVFSFGVFVHLDEDIIRGYLKRLRRVIHRNTQVVIHYSDKDKPLARQNAGFSENNPRRMRAMVEDAGYRILEEDTRSLDSSAIMRFTPRRFFTLKSLLRAGS